jgi:hypothetical protein
VVEESAFKNVGVEDSMEEFDDFKERRKYPRSLVDLPFEYRTKDLPDAYGGLVINVSEGGLLIHSVKDMPVGLKLNMAILFPNGYELADVEVSAEIIWKDLHFSNNSEGYQYGLKIVQILEGDRWKLKQLLSNLARSGSSITLNVYSHTSPPE